MFSLCKISLCGFVPGVEGKAKKIEKSCVHIHNCIRQDRDVQENLHGELNDKCNTFQDFLKSFIARVPLTTHRVHSHPE